jgi:sulfide:quinone oxidoreductase
MDIQQLDKNLSVSAQPGFDDIEKLENAGFRTIIASRPRNETDDQPDTEALKNKAESLGMTWHEIPVEPGKYARKDIEAFASALQSSTDPILGYCRTGKRATHLWAYAKATHYPVADLLSKASAAGYDLEPLRDDLEIYRNQLGKQ